MKFIDLNESEVLKQALNVFSQTNFDLEDCYNLVYAKSKKTKSFLTFDVKLNNYFKNY